MSKLVVLSEGFTGRTYELKVERTTVGRVDDNTFHIPEGSVSSHHCELILKGNDVLVKDLNSTNGTFINGEKISEAVLKPGQILRLGQLEMRLEADGAPSGSGGTTTTSSQKKPLDQTRQLPRGVSKTALEQTATVKFDKNSPFAKKSNKINLIFIGVGIVLALVIIVFIVMAVMKVNVEGTPQ
ncbi:MAG: FHA domain-containing protein [Verrucomicrobiota bacterium]|nr:FHA domain-containing protein [Verrucomicrobiota bacterium]